MKKHVAIFLLFLFISFIFIACFDVTGGSEPDEITFTVDGVEQTFYTSGGIYTSGEETYYHILSYEDLDDSSSSMLSITMMEPITVDTYTDTVGWSITYYDGSSGITYVGTGGTFTIEITLWEGNGGDGSGIFNGTLNNVTHGNVTITEGSFSNIGIYNADD